MIIQDICKSSGYLGPRASTKGHVGQYCTIVLALYLYPCKTGSKILGPGKEAKFQPFVDVLLGPLS